MANAILIDTTRCDACRGCQVACKQWNDLPAQSTNFFGGPGYQNPADLSSVTLTLVRFLQSAGMDLDAYANWLFLKRQCNHCVDAACINVCAAAGYNAAKRDSSTGFVYIDENLCTGCGACNIGYSTLPGCPFDIPRIGLAPDKIAKKCNACLNRLTYQYPDDANPSPDPIKTESLIGWDLMPACVTSCPTGALQYGDRDSEIIPAANARASDPCVQDKYPDVNVYGATGPFGGLHVIYVLAKDPSFYGLPPESWTLDDVVPNPI